MRGVLIVHKHPNQALQQAAFACDIPSLFVLSSCCTREFIADLAFKVYNENKERKYKQTALFLLLCLLPKRPGKEEKDDRAKIPEYMVDVLKDPADLPFILGMYWKNRKLPNCPMFLRGLARVFSSFTEEQFMKTQYCGPVRLRDVLCMCNPKGKTPEQSKFFDRIANGEILR